MTSEGGTAATNGAASPAPTPVTIDPFAGPVEHPDGVTVLVLGIVSILLPILSPAPLLRGRAVLRQMDEHPGHYSNRGIVTAGTVCGGIGACLFLLGIIVVLSSR